MSSIWTPGGEVPLGRGRGPSGSDDASGAGAGPDPLDTDPDDTDRDDIDLLDDDTVDPDLVEEVSERMADAQRRLAETPARVVVANHAMGLYELAAIHLSQQPPNLDDARLAIDAMGIMVEGLEGRMAEEATLRDALGQLRMAFVQVKAAAEE